MMQQLSPLRNSSGLKKGDCAVITPRKLVTSEDWGKLLQLMDSVCKQNRVMEEAVYQDVQPVVAELRQANYDKQSLSRTFYVDSE